MFWGRKAAQIPPTPLYTLPGKTFLVSLIGFLPSRLISKTATSYRYEYEYFEDFIRTFLIFYTVFIYCINGVTASTVSTLAR